MIWNGAAICGRRVQLKIFVRVWSDMWKFFERESAMILYVPFICCEYMDVLLLKRVKPRQRDTASCDYAFIGSKYYLFIQQSALELSVDENICVPCPSCWIVIYIDIVDARNYNMFSVSLL